MSKKKLNNIILWILLGLCVLVEFLPITFHENEVKNAIVEGTITRILAGFFFIILIKENDVNVCSFKPKKDFCVSALICIPALVVAVNNMPILSLASGNCEIYEGTLWIILMLVQCFAVGFFEELAFRGLLFPYFLRKCKSRLQVFLCLAITSCIFGLYHLLNLIEGAGFGAVIQQVGYSALVGAMCATCMLITGNVIIPIFIHGVYNFCGLVVPTLGGGDWWDTPTIIMTVVIAVFATAYFLVVFIKKKEFRLLKEMKLDL